MLDLRKRDVTKMSAEELEKWIDEVDISEVDLTSDIPSNEKSNKEDVSEKVQKDQVKEEICMNVEEIRFNTSKGVRAHTFFISMKHLPANVKKYEQWQEGSLKKWGVRWCVKVQM